MTLRNVRLAAAWFTFAVLAGCSSGTDAPVATSIAITPSQLTINSLNFTTQPLVGRVIDQRGDSMAGVTIAWSSSNTAVATVNPTTGAVTSVSNGTSTVTATAGSASQGITVTVNQVAVGAAKAGDNQFGTVAAALGSVISVHVTDAGGNAVANRPVAFVVTAGGGSLANVSATTNATGDAQASWTLGTTAGAPQTVTVTIGTLVASFSATAQAGPASAITILAGNNQTRVVNTEVLTDPSVRVTDAFGNGKFGLTVDFTPTAGGGSVTGGTKTTDASGNATVSSWTMGGSAGTNTLQAAVLGTALTVNFTATAVVAGAPANIAVHVGNNQTALVSYPTNVRPAVIVTDAGGQPVAGVSVTFGLGSGGGSVTNGTVNTNALGIAQVGNWAVGAVAGANTLTATAAPGGITGNPLTFNATGVVSTFNLVIVNVGPPFSASVQAAIDSAEAFWERAIIGDLPDISLSYNAGDCGTGSPALPNTIIDDVRIVARFDSIDHTGGTLGQASPCFIRTTGTSTIHSTIAGFMRFDTADVGSLVSQNLLNQVVRHEIGHVLGFGPYWPASVGSFTGFGCLQNPSSTGSSPDTHFNCGSALAAFDSIGGTNYSVSSKVPVENCGQPTLDLGVSCGGGNRNSHWREPTFGLELMSGYLSPNVANPISLLSIAAMQDIGFVVNYGAAENYSQPFPTIFAALAAHTGGTVIDLTNDVPRVPLHFVDPSGRRVGVWRP